MLLKSTIATLEKGKAERSNEETIAAKNDLYKNIPFDSLNESQIILIRDSMSSDLSDDDVNFLNWYNKVQEEEEAKRKKALLLQRQNEANQLYAKGQAEKSDFDKCIKTSSSILKNIEHSSSVDKDFMIAFIPIENNGVSSEGTAVLDDVKMSELIKAAVDNLIPGNGTKPVVISVKGEYFKELKGINTLTDERPLNLISYKSSFQKILDMVNRNIVFQKFANRYPGFIRFRTGVRKPVVR